VLRIEALHGAPGAGKSTIAKAACFNSQIQSHFQGVLWTELGTDAKPIQGLTRWIRVLGEPDFQPSSINEASDHLRIRLQGRKMLLVLDDAWRAEDVQPFLVASDSVVLVTTRVATVIEDVRARSLDISPMSDTEAITLLQEWLGREIRTDELSAAKRLTASVDHLPLALELAGSLLSRGVDWDTARSAFESETEYLLNKHTNISRQRAKVFACIRISVRELSKQHRLAWERFALLGTVARGTEVTSEVAATFWRTTGGDAVLTLQELQDNALLQHGSDNWHFHNLIQDVALETLTDPHPEGLGITLEQAHSGFLEACGWSNSKGVQSLLHKDGYTSSHLTWHLEMAGQRSAIHELLSASNDEGQCAWWNCLTSQNQVPAFLTDVDRASRLALLEPDPFPLLYRYSAIRSSLLTIGQCFSPAVLRSLVERGFWDFKQAFAVAKQVQSKDRAAEVYAVLAETSSQSGDNSLSSQIIEAANEL
jgi:hypothetical protein